MNIWLFWHDFRFGGDSVIQKCEGNSCSHSGRHDYLVVTFCVPADTRRSATGFGLVTTVLLAWIAAFSLGQYVFCEALDGIPGIINVELVLQDKKLGLAKVFLTHTTWPT